MKVQVQLLLLLLLSLFFAGIASAARSAIVGGWSPVDPKEGHVVEIGKFAVDEENKKSKTDLKFQTVIKGEKQVVAGLNYRLVIAATNEKGSAQHYEAVVYERAWEHHMELTSFKAIAG